jgi:large subunit ribosomal protein L14e
MNLYRTGRVCVKTMGREAGSLCVIVEKMEGNYVVVTGPKHISGVRRRRCNTHHLEPLDTILRITTGADDETVEKAIESEGLTERFRKPVRIQL